MQHFEDALALAPGIERPRFMTMRHTAIFENDAEKDIHIAAVQHQGRQFENLFRNLEPVLNGFPQPADPEVLVNQSEYTEENLMNNLIFGSPEQAIENLKQYETLGVDYFCYNASFGVPMAEQKKSLRLFIDKVMPAFQ